MITRASTANAAIILVDARHGIMEQTKKHVFIASLLQISHVIVCINKMGLIDFSEKKYNKIIGQFEGFASKFMVKDLRFIPISALNGDNVVIRSKNMNWYQGVPLLHTLETMHISSDINKVDVRFPEQTVLRPQNGLYRNYRGYTGRVANGFFRLGDEVTAMPSGFSSKIKSIDVAEGA